MPAFRQCVFGMLILLFVAACDASDRHFDNAVVAFENGNFAGAISLLTFAIESGDLDHARLARAYKLRGMSYLVTGPVSRAEADLAKAIELDPSDVDLRHARASALVKSRDYDGALHEIDRAVELNPGDALALGNRCDILRLLRRYDDALADCDRAIELDPGFAPPWMERAKLHWDMGDEASARSDIRRARELWPDGARVRQLAERYDATAR